MKCCSPLPQGIRYFGLRRINDHHLPYQQVVPFMCMYRPHFCSILSCSVNRADDTILAEHISNHHRKDGYLHFGTARANLWAEFVIGTVSLRCRCVNAASVGGSTVLHLLRIAGPNHSDTWNCSPFCTFGSNLLPLPFGTTFNWERVCVLLLRLPQLFANI